MTQAIRKEFAADTVNFTPGERSFTAWVSTDIIDHDGDVVVAAGVDFKSVFMGDSATGVKGNPVVLAVHNMGRWPIGKCEWMKVRKTPAWTGIFAKTLLDDDPDSEIVWRKIKSETLRGISIQFIPPDDFRKEEWGPPTPQEIRDNPKWKGAKQIIRRCVAIEYSVVPIGANKTALVDAIAKGFHKPSYKDTPMDEDVIKPDEEAVTKAAKPVGDPKKETDDADADEELEDEEEDDAEPDPIVKGTHVKCMAKSCKGVGVVQSVHKDEMVPDVEDDIMGSKDDPGLRVKMYKAMGDGHMPTDFHRGVHASEVEQLEEKLKRPSKGKSLNLTRRTTLDNLPPLIGKTDAEIASEQKAKLDSILSPANIEKAFRLATDRATGTI